MNVAAVRAQLVPHARDDDEAVQLLRVALSTSFAENSDALLSARFCFHTELGVDGGRHRFLRDLERARARYSARGAAGDANALVGGVEPRFVCLGYPTMIDGRVEVRALWERVVEPWPWTSVNLMKSFIRECDRALTWKAEWCDKIHRFARAAASSARARAEAVRSFAAARAGIDQKRSSLLARLRDELPVLAADGVAAPPAAPPPASSPGAKSRASHVASSALCSVDRSLADHALVLLRLLGAEAEGGGSAPALLVADGEGGDAADDISGVRSDVTADTDALEEALWDALDVSSGG